MTLIGMRDLAFTSPGTTSTCGVSGPARFIAAEFERGRRRLQETYSLGLRAKGVFNELLSVTQQCASANWDGYGAAPVARDTFRQASLFLEALPLGTPAPSVGAEPDGHLTFEWHQSARRTLSVSVSPEGDLHYAALLGRRKAYGTEPFFGDIPRSILDLIHQVDPA